MGKVYLVGAGPGDPGLLTLRGLECLEQADVVLYDRLVDSRLLERARPGAELTFVGKEPGGVAMRQDEIDSYMIEQARDGKVVARLKGGDPFVFGRGGEEALALAAEGIPFEVVPGVTSAIAAPAYAGIPLTHRGLASSFTVVTGNEDPSKVEMDVSWEHLARSGGTIVVLMGWAGLENITSQLMDHGMAPDTPAALIQWGTEPYQKCVTAPLGDIVAQGKDVGLAPPVVLVVGPVVKLREQLRWFDTKPLFGRKVLVTRTRRQASSLSMALAREGAQPMEVPAIQVSPLDGLNGSLAETLRSLKEYSWVVLTSVNGVEVFFDRLAELGLDSRVLAGPLVAAIGPATAQALGSHGIRADFVPDSYLSEALVSGLATKGIQGHRVLLLRAEQGNPELSQGLETQGAKVDQISLYRTQVADSSRQRARELLAEDTIDVATFTSSSTVQGLVDLLDGDITLMRRLTIACIGPVTAQTARELGLNVDVVASRHTIEGLVEALVEYYGGTGR